MCYMQFMSLTGTAAVYMLIAKLVLFSRVKHRFSLISLYVVFQPSGLSGSSAPPPLIRGTIASSKGSPQVSTLISHMHTICLKAQLHCSWCHFSRCVFSFSSLNQILTGRSSGTVIPPPLVRGGQQISSKHGSQIIMPPLVRGAQVSHGKTHPCQVNYSLKVFCGSVVFYSKETDYREKVIFKRRTYVLSLRLPLFLCVLCFGAFWCPFLVLCYLCVCVAPLIVVVSPSLCLHSRFRLSASSSSNSWLPLEARGLVLLLCCWVPGTLTPRAREEWSNQASSESAARWLVCHQSLNVKKTIRVGREVIHSSRLEA